MALIRSAIPPVSREFALELKRRFKAFDVKPGFDRDALMQSVGEQRVINWILYHSNNTIVKSSIEPDTITEQNPTEAIVADTEHSVVPVEEPSIKSWWRNFTTRFGL